MGIEDLSILTRKIVGKKNWKCAETKVTDTAKTKII